MTQAEVYLMQLLEAGYSQQEAVSLVDFYSECNRLYILKSYVTVKNLSRGE